MNARDFCPTHGRYTPTTIPGCPQCPKGGVYVTPAFSYETHKPAAEDPQWALRGLAADLMRERDRYRDALREVKRLLNQDESVTLDEMFVNVEHVVDKALGSSPTGSVAEEGNDAK